MKWTRITSFSISRRRKKTHLVWKHTRISQIKLTQNLFPGNFSYIFFFSLTQNKTKKVRMSCKWEVLGLTSSITGLELCCLYPLLASKGIHEEGFQQSHISYSEKVSVDISGNIVWVGQWRLCPSANGSIIFQYNRKRLKYEGGVGGM